MKPLQGVSILDLSSNIAGPLATLTLARLGARVIKVERPTGDPSRAWSPQVNGMSLVFDGLNRGKLGIGVNLSHSSGREVLHQLIDQCQVLIHNFTPDVAAKLLLTEDDVHAVNAEIIYCNVGAFGSGTVGARLPGYDGVAQAFTGIMEMTGEPGSPPTRCAPAVVDVSTGQWLVISILAALLGQHQGEKVSSIETALVDTALGLVPYQATEALLTGERPPKYGTGSPLGAPHEVFPTQDRPIFIGAPSQNLWQELIVALDAPHLLDDPRYKTGTDRLDNIVALRDSMADVLSGRTAAEWQERLADAGVPTAEVLGLEETVVHPLAAERRWFETADGNPPIVRMPVIVDGAVVTTPGHAPQLGEHTAFVLGELGMSADEVRRLADLGAVVIPSEVHQ
jgi:crotonobetainyl-CoA:carnitine CoA-transferase CaiB-like acyl-CoA transferase